MTTILKSDTFQNLDNKTKASMIGAYMSKSTGSNFGTHSSSDEGNITITNRTTNNTSINKTSDQVVDCINQHIKQTNLITCTDGTISGALTQQNTMALKCIMGQSSNDTTGIKTVSSTDASAKETSSNISGKKSGKTNPLKPGSNSKPNSKLGPMMVAGGSSVSVCSFGLICIVIIGIMFMTMGSSSKKNIPSQMPPNM